MRSVRVGLVAVALGALYLVVPYREARSCLGMECLTFVVAAAPVAGLSQPWSILARGLAPELADQPETIYRGMLLQRKYLPVYIATALGFLFNLFLGAAGAHAAYSWFTQIQRRTRGGAA